MQVMPILVHNDCIETGKDIGNRVTETKREEDEEDA